MGTAVINKLGRVALAGFVACCGSYYLFQKNVSETLINSEFGKNAMEMVRNHSGAKHFLGEPITPVNAKFSDYGKSSRYVEMSVLGSKSTGKVFLTINEVSEKKFELESVQLQIGRDDSKRLEIKSCVASAS